MADADLSARLAPMRRLLPPIGSWQAVLWAIGFLSIGALLRLPFDAAINARLPPYLTVYPAVVLASFAGGLRIGAGTALVGAAMSWALWLAPTGYEIPAYFPITGAAYLLAVGITVAASGLARHLLDASVAQEAARAAEARETVHRIKNSIAVIQALSRKIAAQTPDKETYLERFHERLRALASAQDILVRTDWQATDIKTVAEAALAPFLASDHLKLARDPSLIVPAWLVSGLSLALYELATNAAKYGALGGAEGAVTLSWRKEGERCKVEWREASPAISKGKDGLGSVLIRSAMNAAPEGRVAYTLAPGMISCVFEWPDEKV